jgi:hypothetical protein
MTFPAEGENLKTWPAKERKIWHGHRLGYKPPTHRTLTSSCDNTLLHIISSSLPSHECIFQARNLWSSVLLNHVLSPAEHKGVHGKELWFLQFLQHQCHTLLTVCSCLEEVTEHGYQIGQRDGQKNATQVTLFSATCYPCTGNSTTCVIKIPGQVFSPSKLC